MRIANRSEWRDLLILALVAVPILATVPSTSAADLPAFTPDSNAARSTIPEVYKWDLTPLFDSDEAWDAARLRLLKDIPGLEAYAGKLVVPVAL